MPAVRLRTIAMQLLVSSHAHVKAAVRYSDLRSTAADPRATAFDFRLTPY
jgi:hypothetical protein